MNELPEAVIDGVRKFIRLTALTSNPQYAKRIRDEQDLAEAFDVVAIYFRDTERMVGKKIYRGQAFDPIEDVKRATEEYFLAGRDAKETALARGKNLAMYHLAVVPLIEMFKDMDHEEALTKVQAAVDQAKKLILTMDLQSHYDDALVAQMQVSKMIREREVARKAEIAKRKRGKRRKKKDDLSDWLEQKEKDGSSAF